MKLVTAIIRVESLDTVKQALFDNKIYKMTVSHVRGCGQQKGFTESYRGEIINVNLLPKVKLEIALNDEFVDNAVKTIMMAAKSGNVGDGKIFVTPIDEVYRIRTEESGSDAIG